MLSFLCTETGASCSVVFFTACECVTNQVITVYYCYVCEMQSAFNCSVVVSNTSVHFPMGSELLFIFFLVFNTLISSVYYTSYSARVTDEVTLTTTTLTSTGQ